MKIHNYICIYTTFLYLLYKSRLTFHNLFSKIKTENVRGAILLWGKIYYIVDFPPGGKTTI